MTKKEQAAMQASIDIPELDIDMMRRLYDSGGLAAYRVVYFDPVVLKSKIGFFTLNEKVAKGELERLKQSGFTVGMEAFVIRFDGAFSKTPKTQN